MSKESPTIAYTEYVDGLSGLEIDRLVESARNELPGQEHVGRTWGLLIPALLRRVDELNLEDHE